MNGRNSNIIAAAVASVATAKKEQIISAHLMFLTEGALDDLMSTAVVMDPS